eukprot:TRINITY_DN4034_c0_g1_i1.p1 TRINITY_DN4034_c0_g1~~TRINITY_DN4034_c0_g1_i1.p1  ORF type:complete len:182 (+),score=22.77 TRINITY_DN4034_c0_g1_i1:189-734(+)
MGHCSASRLCCAEQSKHDRDIEYCQESNDGCHSSAASRMRSESRDSDDQSTTSSVASGGHNPFASWREGTNDMVGEDDLDTDDTGWFACGSYEQPDTDLAVIQSAMSDSVYIGYGKLKLKDRDKDRDTEIIGQPTPGSFNLATTLQEERVAAMKLAVASAAAEARQQSGQRPEAVSRGNDS